MRTIATGALRLVLLGATLVLPQRAEAQCLWTGGGWACAPAGSYAYGWNDPAFGYPRERGTGPYDAYGAASHMGPNPGGGFYHMGKKYGSVD